MRVRMNETRVSQKPVSVNEENFKKSYSAIQKMTGGSRFHSPGPVFAEAPIFATSGTTLWRYANNEMSMKNARSVRKDAKKEMREDTRVTVI
jgi:hypothetical protein